MLAGKDGYQCTLPLLLLLLLPATTHLLHMMHDPDKGTNTQF
jgi:hypothetical protein